MSLVFTVTVTHDKVVVSWPGEDRGETTSQVAEGMGVVAAKTFGMTKLASSSFGLDRCAMVWERGPLRTCKYGHGGSHDKNLAAPAETCLCAPSCPCREGRCKPRISSPGPGGPPERLLMAFDGSLILEVVAEAIEAHGEHREMAIARMRDVAHKMAHPEEGK